MKLLALISLIGVLVCNRVQAQPTLANDILAIVNEVPITRFEVVKDIAPFLDVLERQYRDNPAERQKREMSLQIEKIEDLIARQLILFDFTNSGYNLPESLIDNDVDARIRKDYVDRANLIKTLREKGITYENYKREIREGFIIGALKRKHLSEELVVSPHQVERYYETNRAKFQLEDRVKLRSIEVRKSSDAPEETREKAAEILRKLDDGVPFGEMAAIYSEGSQRGKEGDWWERKELKKPLMEAAFALKAGQHSKVVESEDAFHILLVEEISAAHVKSLAEVRDEIERILDAQEQDRLYKQWLARLEKKTFVYRAIPKP